MYNCSSFEHLCHEFCKNNYVNKYILRYYTVLITVSLNYQFS